MISEYLERYGSGRPGYGYPKAEHMKRLDIAYLERRGYLRGGPYRYSWSWGDEPMGSITMLRLPTGLKLMYRTRSGDDEWKDIDELVPFLWTPMKFGGERRWFQCLSCGRRCRILYGGGRFRCRRCRHVRCSSQSETRSDRATRAMFKIVKRLDPQEECNDLPWKPKGMHWRTYNRLVERYDRYDGQWGLEAMRRFGIKL
jgi:hypothetical protein